MMHILKAIVRKCIVTLGSVSYQLTVIGAGAILLMMLVSVVDVAGRYFFNRPITGAYDIVGVLLVCGATLALAYCETTDSHIRLTFIVDRLPHRLNKILRDTGYVISLGILLLIIWQMFTRAYLEAANIDIVDATLYLKIPFWPFRIIFGISLSIFCLVLLGKLLQNWSKFETIVGVLFGIAILVGLGVASPVITSAVKLHTTMIGALGIGIMLLMIFLGIPIGVTLAFTGFVGVAWLLGLNPAVLGMSIIPWSVVSSYQFSVIPLFMLMGILVSESGIGKESFDAAKSWIGHIRGGLSMATIMACGLFAATCGSSMATAITLGKVAHPEMRRHGYSNELSLGCIAAGGSLGILIPPSMGFITIGILTELSIGKLFMAGIIPGILEIVFYIITISILCRKYPHFGPPSSDKASFKDKVSSVKSIWPVGVLFVLVIGGIYGGVFTPTEAGGIGAFGALVIALIRKRLTRKSFTFSVVDTARTTSMMVILIVGAFIYMQFLALSRIPFLAGELIGGLDLPPYFILIFIILIYVILGSFFDIMAIIVITVPIIFPIIEALGFSPIWFSVILVRMMEVGMVTPPFGINLFALTGVTGIPMGTLYRGVFPFVIADLCHIALLVAIPQLSTFLPSLM